ncbi:serine phosphatase RsbU (regulator of sigma subunit) [Streptomyces sp. SLBN-118]|uniref:PP2C family protein-serine/threonine phosphatase n=1 Tax=Streptomyces sp. SLBN-118 TaxID=2768454 RepID=UPI0011719579|nr:GAF domain-containing SpoIIE family protein phosphatase [Streptomyces sp. SLBN-118]TQK50927.1 serine phosphatase RsbU (regulator of sigma subunit) [Streptomyces sp. SLBN-118]
MASKPHSHDERTEAVHDVDRAVQHALDRLTLLTNASEALASTLDIDEGLRRLCRTVVPGLADWCAVDLLDERGRLCRQVVEHREPDLLSPGLYEGELPPAEKSAASVARALRGAGPLLVTTFTAPAGAADPLHARELELFDHLGADTVVIAPLRARRQVLGALTLARTEATGGLGEDSLPLAEDLAHRVALAVENARLHGEVQHTGERIQRSLLPDLPIDGPLELAARYQPALATNQVGGDWYDSFVLPGGAMTLIIGDVAGHDLQATVAMSHMRNMLRGIAADRKEPPGKILGRLDAAIGILYPHRTLTCIYALVEKPAEAQPWKLQYAAAGHPTPLLITAEGDTRFLTEGRSMLLGVEPTQRRSDATEVLPWNSTVLFYTDGLIERRAEDLDRGGARLRQHAAALAQEPLESFCDELLSGLAEASNDDVALIAVRIPPRHESPESATATSD